VLALGSADVAAVGAVGVQLGPGLGIGDAKLGLLVTASSLWGRAEGVRTAIRSTLEAFAPLIFGLVAEGLGAGAPTVGPSGSALASTTAGAGQVGGLELAFILMLVPLAAAACCCSSCVAGAPSTSPLPPSRSGGLGSPRGSRPPDSACTSPGTPSDDSYDGRRGSPHRVCRR